jgi:hypothetical protein
LPNTAEKERERERKRGGGGRGGRNRTKDRRQRGRENYRLRKGKRGEMETKREAWRGVSRCTFITRNPPHADLLRPLVLASLGLSSTRCAASVKSSHSASPLGSMADVLCGSSAAQQAPSVWLACCRLCSVSISAAASPWCASWPRQACSSSAKYRSAMAD